MAYSQADLNRLQAALADPTQKVRFDDGREVTYRTMAELRLAISDVSADLARQAAGGRPAALARRTTFRRS